MSDKLYTLLMTLPERISKLYKIGKHHLLMRQPYKISFCTVCMNRLHHIQQTLPANLRDNATYPRAEFVLLDYNSSDGLEDWIKSELKEFIDSGRLVYYKTTDPQYFHRSHSRNMAFKLASGDIVCNVDADNFTGKNFAYYINRQFIANDNIFIIPDIHKRHYFIRDVFGRISCWKKDFEAIGGFDEQLDGYGHEDVDLIYKLTRLNRKEVIIFDRSFLKAISHTDLERIQNESSMGNLKGLYIWHVTTYSSRLLFLFTDNTFSTGMLIDTVTEDAAMLPRFGQPKPHEQALNGRFVLSDGTWKNGLWEINGDLLSCTSFDGHEEKFYYGEESLTAVDQPSHQNFVRIVDQKVTIRAINIYSLIKNSTKVNENKVRKLMSTAELGVGSGSVIKNFSEEMPIIV